MGQSEIEENTLRNTVLLVSTPGSRVTERGQHISAPRGIVAENGFQLAHGSGATGLTVEFGIVT